MRFSRFFILTFLSFLFCAWLGLVAAYGQETDDEIELRSVDYISPVYKFGIALPEGYMAFDFTDEESGAWVLNIAGEFDQATALISAEELPDDVIDVAGFWQLLKDRDPLMERNITYEKVDSVAGCGAVQARIEGMESGEYILAITWAFVRDGYGFTLSGYPSAGGDNNSARDLALDLSGQFRWMTDEEIEEWESVEHEIEIPEGEEF